MNAAAYSFLGIVLAALISGGFVWLGRRVDARASKTVAETQRDIDERKVDQGDFDLMTDRLWREINRLDLELGKERRRVGQLEAAMRDAGVEIPPPLPDPPPVP